MKFEKLIDFIENKMSMSHIYQPLLIVSGAVKVMYLWRFENA